MAIEGKVPRVLSNQHYMAACDVAVLVNDSSTEHSWKKTRNLLEKVSREGELTDLIEFERE